MGGGGGTIANNYFASEVKPDGLTIMQDSSSSVASFARGGPAIKYDPRKFRVIGGVARPGSLLMIRNDARDRLTNRSAKPVVVGDTDGIRNWIAMTVWGTEYLGWNLRWIYGYPGSRELQLAIRQGEIDIWATQNAKLVKDLQREGVVQIIGTEEDQRRADFPDAPTFLELLGSKKPTGLSWQAYQSWAGAPELDKYLVAPEGTPDHLIKLLREAFMQVMKDPEVDKDGDKFFGDGWRAHSAEKIEGVIREHIAIPKEAKDYITKCGRNIICRWATQNRKHRSHKHTRKVKRTKHDEDKNSRRPICRMVLGISHWLRSEAPGARRRRITKARRCASSSLPAPAAAPIRRPGWCRASSANIFPDIRKSSSRTCPVAAVPLPTITSPPKSKPDGLTVLQDSSSGIVQFRSRRSNHQVRSEKIKMIGGVARSGSLLMIATKPGRGLLTAARNRWW